MARWFTMAILVLFTSVATAVEVRFEPVAENVYAHVGDIGARSVANDGLNANLVHKWRRASEGAIARPATHALTHEGAGAFIALAMPPQAVAAALADIRIELRRGATAMTITWPSAASADCAAWIRELLVEPRR